MRYITGTIKPSDKWSTTIISSWVSSECELNRNPCFSFSNGFLNGFSQKCEFLTEDGSCCTNLDEKESKK